MTWLTWRQHRNELLIVLAIVAGLAAYLVPIGLERNDLFHASGLKACVDAAEDCPELRFQVLRGYNPVNNIIGWFNFVPGIVGLLLAAPIVAEFEQRTYRLAWTQSVTRERWLMSKLGIAIGGVAFFAVLLTLLVTWTYAPYDQAEILGGKDLGQSYDFEGAMPFAYTFFAFALALSAGAVSRRLPVAMVVGLGGFIILRLLLMELIRQGITADIDISVGPGMSLAEHTRDTDKFWAAQAKEGAIFLASAVALLGLTVWQVRRYVA